MTADCLHQSLPTENDRFVIIIYVCLYFIFYTKVYTCHCSQCKLMLSHPLMPVKRKIQRFMETDSMMSIRHVSFHTATMWHIYLFVSNISVIMKNGLLEYIRRIADRDVRVTSTTISPRGSIIIRNSFICKINLFHTSWFGLVCCQLCTGLHHLRKEKSLFLVSLAIWHLLKYTLSSQLKHRNQQFRIRPYVVIGVYFSVWVAARYCSSSFLSSSTHSLRGIKNNHWFKSLKKTNTVLVWFCPQMASKQGLAVSILWKMFSIYFSQV